MAIDSNSQGDERAASNPSDKPSGAALKLVGDRGFAGGTAGATPGAAGGAPSGASRVADGGNEAGGFATGSGPARARRAARGEGRKLPLWMFVVLAILFLVGYGYQTHQATQLGEEVVRLEQSLAKAEARLESHRTHLLEIRGGVHDLSTRLESLRDLIDRDPNDEAPLAAPGLGAPEPAPEAISPR